MAKIKLCGLSRPCDIEAANELKPDYIGFVFAPKSHRYVTAETAEKLKSLLDPCITAVGVFVDEKPEKIAQLLGNGIIDMAQLHGHETQKDIETLRTLTGKPIIKAFQIGGLSDVLAAQESDADLVLLDSGSGTGRTFDWKQIETIQRPYFLAGGLDTHNVKTAIETLHPYAVDVSSGIEENGYKSSMKMKAFVDAVRSVCTTDNIHAEMAQK